MGEEHLSLFSSQNPITSTSSRRLHTAHHIIQWALGLSGTFISFYHNIWNPTANLYNMPAGQIDISLNSHQDKWLYSQDVFTHFRCPYYCWWMCTCRELVFTLSSPLLYFLKKMKILSSLTALFHCMVRFSTACYGTILGAFPLHGTARHGSLK